MSTACGGEPIKSVSPASPVDAGVGTVSVFDAPHPKVDLYDWRSEPCELDPDALTPKMIPGPSGKIRLSPSSTMQPISTRERVGVEVLSMGSDALDGHASGALTFDSDGQVELLEPPMLVAGEAEFTVRFLAPGMHTLHISLADGSGREGTVTVFAFRTQLAMWEMSIAQADLDAMRATPDVDVVRSATLSIDGVSHPVQARLHGGSSRGFPKLSFRFDLEGSDTLPDGSSHVILRAEYVDKSLLRNYLAFELVRAASAIPAPRTRIIHFRINDREYGVMWHVERIDTDYLKARGLSKGVMYEADPPITLQDPGGNLTPLPSLDAYQQVYSQKSGPADYSDLIDLIEHKLPVPPSTFSMTVPAIVDIHEYIRYMAIMTVLQSQDHVRKNYYLYRDPSSATHTRWAVLPWDSDLTFGHLWTENNDILDETIFTNGSPYVGKLSNDSHFYNQMMTQILSVPAWDKEFWDDIRETIAMGFSHDRIKARIDEALCRAAPDILADPKKRAHNDEYAQRVAEILDFVDARTTFLESRDPYAP